ncbi:hypothetical protein DI396_04680 [Litorivita pollutaquae]|uniref:Uncharacterized protein n=1 Tax=Litorivita pollutaquae TaxID=2200892 RepID=A0A2V4NPE2_9RHOB|nr:hypothetical protein DI396_04680 [Litorivita pollutaquae]
MPSHDLNVTAGGDQRPRRARAFVVGAILVRSSDRNLKLRVDVTGQTFDATANGAQSVPRNIEEFLKVTG